MQVHMLIKNLHVDNKDLAERYSMCFCLGTSKHFMFLLLSSCNNLAMSNFLNQQSSARHSLHSRESAQIRTSVFLSKCSFSFCCFTQANLINIGTLRTKSFMTRQEMHHFQMIKLTLKIRLF